MNDVVNPPEPRSLATVLQSLRQSFPDALFGGYGWERLLGRASSVPASLISTTFGFEVRLRSPRPAADFCVTLKAGSDNASEYLNFPPVDEYYGTSETGESSLGNPKRDSQRCQANKALSCLLAEIARDGSFASEALKVPVIILEYDVVETELGQNPAPGVFWGLAEHVGPEQMEGMVQLLDIVQLQPSGRSVNDSRTATLQRIAEATMPYGRISQVGTFLGRKTRNFRINIKMEDRSGIGECLGDIGWPGNVDRVVDTVSIFDLENLSFGVSLDVCADGVGPRMGLEVAAKGGWITTRYAHWQPLIEVFVANGWCPEDKAMGLKQWCGFLRLYGPEMYMLLKGINHFKINFQDEEDLVAKVYLGACRELARDLGLE